MAKIKFTSALKHFFPTLSDHDISVASVEEALQAIEKIYPGMLNYIVNEDGSLRKHVNIFVKGELIKDRITLKDKLNPQDELLIFQALSGG